MWGISAPHLAWVDAMTAQTLHEIDCQACRHYRLPACDEGRRLQQEARAAHERWTTDRAYATEAAA